MDEVVRDVGEAEEGEEDVVDSEIQKMWWNDFRKGLSFATAFLDNASCGSFFQLDAPSFQRLACRIPQSRKKNIC